MTPLQQRMREELQLRGLSDRTQEISVRATHHLPGSRKKHSETPSALSSRSSTPRGARAPLRSAVARASLSTPSHGHGPP